MTFVQNNDLGQEILGFSDDLIDNEQGEFYDQFAVRVNKYLNKTFLGNFGTRHGQDDLAPVYRLNSPTYEVPVKYIDDFNLDGLSSNGTFVVDFNKGPRYSQGGKL